jgi:hypothetical protein|tara:strand:- start:177 stop:377 length:201 start_codon:yes stop_codon:yes gene_type:complete
MKRRDKLVEYTFSIDNIVSVTVPWGTSDQIVEEKALNKFKEMLSNNRADVMCEEVMSVYGRESEVE